MINTPKEQLGARMLSNDSTITAKAVGCAWRDGESWSVSLKGRYHTLRVFISRLWHVWKPASFAFLMSPALTQRAGSTHYSAHHALKQLRCCGYVFSCSETLEIVL